jgi:hypothetical protein
MSDTDYTRLIEQVEQDPPMAWIASDDDPILVGTFVRLERGNTAYGSCFIAVLKTEDGTERSVWLIHAVLRNELTRFRPQPGELVAIKYLGKKTNSSGHPYVAYKVAVERDSTPINWAALHEGDPTSDWDALDPDTPPAVVVASSMQSNDIPF